MNEEREEWTWQMAAPNVISPTVTATAETCSQSCTILSSNMGLSQDGIMTQDAALLEEGQDRGKIIPMEFSRCRGTEEKDWKEPPELIPHTGIQPLLLSQEHYSFLPASPVFCYRLQTKHLQQLKKQLWAHHWNTTRGELFQIHSAPSLLADNFTCYRSDSVPAHTLQGGGAALL